MQDERHTGLGTDVLHASRVAPLNRAVGSCDDGDRDADGGEDGEGEMFSGGTAMGGFQFGVDRLSFCAEQGGVEGARMNGLPSKLDLDRNFLRTTGMLLRRTSRRRFSMRKRSNRCNRGLYHALYAFDPEGTAEMALAEDQIVRVVGRGGGVGWAVVVDERGAAGAQGKGKWALVPESYLEAVRLDGVDE